MSFNGDLYPEAGASVVMTTKGDLVRYDSQRERYGIGSTNQVLSVTAGLPAWKTLTTADSVLTTQGDVLYEGASALARLGQSTNNYTLATKGAGANPAWQASSTSTLTTAGDLLVASGANTLSRLARGSDNQVLTMNGTALNWETASGGLTITTTTTTLGAANFTTTNTTFTAVTNLSVTVQNSAGGTSICSFTGTGYNETSTKDMYWAIMDDGSSIASSPKALMEPSKPQFIGSYCFQSTDGSVVQVYVKTTSGGTANFYGNNANYESSLHVIEWY